MLFHSLHLDHRAQVCTRVLYEVCTAVVVFAGSLCYLLSVPGSTAQWQSNLHSLLTKTELEGQDLSIVPQFTSEVALQLSEKCSTAKG